MKIRVEQEDSITSKSIAPNYNITLNVSNLLKWSGRESTHKSDICHHYDHGILCLKSVKCFGLRFIVWKHCFKIYHLRECTYSGTQTHFILGLYLIACPLIG